MKIRYMRLSESVGSPGYAGSDISVAKVRSSMNEGAGPREQLMDSIDLVGDFVVLSAFRTVEGQKDRRLWQRMVHVSKVRDMEPLETIPIERLEAAHEQPKTKGNAK